MLSDQRCSNCRFEFVALGRPHRELQGQLLMDTRLQQRCRILVAFVCLAILGHLLLAISPIFHRLR